MKRLFAVILVLLCFVQFSACGKSSSPASSVTRYDYEESDDINFDEVDISRLTLEELEQYKNELKSEPEIVESWLDSHDVFDYLDWEYVESSAIEEVSYADWPFNVLGIIFVNSPNRVYLYFDVPYMTYYELVNADSIGKYFNSEIKGQYEFERFDD